MVIAFVGAGSYVFGPSALRQLLDSNLEDVTVRLIDPNLTAIEPLARAVAAEAVRRRRSLKFTVHAKYEEALEGADYVLHSAAPGMRSMFERDRAICESIYPEHILTEFGGVHGITYSVSQARFTAGLADAMRSQCPDAMLLTMANPLTRVCTAAHRRGVRVAGFCSVVIVAYRVIENLFNDRQVDYPFADSMARYDMATVGTNHLSWIVRLRERATGEDLLPRLRAWGTLDTDDKARRYLARTGYLAAAGDGHITDFLPIEGIEHQAHSTSHGSDEDRLRRLRNIEEIVAGRLAFDVLDEHPAWEKPIAVIEALGGGDAVSIPSLSLPNTGQVLELPFGAIVEVPATVSRGEIIPERLSLPPEVLPHNQLAVDLTETIVSFALNGDPTLLEKCLQMDPTIVDKDRGRRALHACLAALPA